MKLGRSSVDVGSCGRPARDERTTSRQSSVTSPARLDVITFGSSVAVALSANDRAAGEWLSEYLEPWFAPTSQPADWRVHLSSSRAAYDALRAHQPAVATARPCFAFDTQVYHLPTWRDGDRLSVADAERSCFFSIAPGAVEIVADPETLRWRFTAALILVEIAATRMRRHSLDLHAAAIELGGRAILLLGSKGAGKTTVAIHLLRSGLCRAIANDRAFASAGGASVVVHGVPTAVKIRPTTLAEFPELLREIPAVERPYLHSLAELRRATAIPGPSDSVELALSPPQFLRQLGAQPCAAAPLGAIVLPDVRSDLDGWDITPLSPAEVSAAIQSNLYGASCGRREPTVFEELASGLIDAPPTLVDRIARTVPGYRLLLGRGAYATHDLAQRFADIAAGTRSP